MTLQPFSVSANPVSRLHMKFKKILRRSISKNIFNPTKLKEQNGAFEVLEKILFVFDGWSTDDTHYVGL